MERWSKQFICFRHCVLSLLPSTRWEFAEGYKSFPSSREEGKNIKNVREISPPSIHNKRNYISGIDFSISKMIVWWKVLEWYIKYYISQVYLSFLLGIIFPPSGRHRRLGTRNYELNLGLVYRPLLLRIFLVCSSLGNTLER